MAEYLHGAYGHIQAAGSRVSTQSRSAIVYIGTAPVHLVEGGAENVNRPVLVNNIAEARNKLGYSDDFAKYTLCEAMNVHLNLKGVGPLIFINVLDPAKHKAAGEGKSLAPSGGRIVIADAEDIILDSVVVGTKVKGTDYTLSYNFEKKTLIIQELTKGGLGSAALQITYNVAKPDAVTDADVIGESDGYGLNTGICALKNVYQETGYIPSFTAAPGFSGVPVIHTALIDNSRKINGHWDAYVLADLPLTDGESAITMATAAAWKNSNGYTNENETVYFPMVSGTDGKKYHLSTLAAANLQELLVAQDGIPYKTASNTIVEVAENLYLGEDQTGRVFDDTMINTVLNQNGIASAAFVGGKWVIWGAHAADYSSDNADNLNVSETNRMMLQYISNDFQHRRSADVDKPLTNNDIQSIVAEEQARLDALKMIGALLYGECHLNAEMDAASDIVKGNFSITFNVTTTPLAKSLTAVVNWTDEGFVTYYESFNQ